MLSPLDLAGWIGGLLTAAAYVLVSSKRIDAEGNGFQLSNILGAALLGLTAWHHGAVPTTFFNLAWIGFGLQALATRRRRRNHETAIPASRALRHPPEPAEHAKRVAAPGHR